MGASTAAGTSLVELSSIRVACKDHIARTVGDAVVWVRGHIFNELVENISSGLSGRGLLGSDGTESDEKFVVDCTSVPQEGAADALDTFLEVAK